MGDGQWKNRMVGVEDDVDPAQLMAHPENAKIHPTAQQKQMASVLARVGVVQRVIVNQRTGRLLDGHMRVAMAITNNQRVAVEYVDLDEDEELVVLASFDALASRAVIDSAMYDDLVAQIVDPDDNLRDLFAAIQKDWDYRKPEPTPDDNGDPGNLDDFVFGMVGWSETKVKADGDEIERLTELHAEYRAENGGNDRGFVQWLTSHV